MTIQKRNGVSYLTFDAVSYTHLVLPVRRWTRTSDVFHECASTMYSVHAGFPSGAILTVS